MDARAIQTQLEMAISYARRATTDDKLSPETRLVMVAVALADIDRLNDQLDVALRAQQPA